MKNSRVACRWENGRYVHTLYMYNAAGERQTIQFGHRENGWWVNTRNVGIARLTRRQVINIIRHAVDMPKVVKVAVKEVQTMKYRMQDPRGTVARIGNNVAVTGTDEHGYTVKVIERMPNYGDSLTYQWAEYCSGLGYGDALRSAANCATVNHAHGGYPEAGYED